mmetsp:Transcript_17643/g.31657  ORF Transcript_17643/g.31657 Transcript_17643/m.31657 type:complete len:144 (+) Transcript_17643:30-461(+)
MALPVVHIVLLQVADPTDPKTLRSMEEAVKTMQTIPGVTGASFGPNYTQRGKGYNFGFVVRFESKESEAKYQVHPDHVRVRDTLIKPLVVKGGAGVLALDYEDLTSTSKTTSQQLPMFLGLVSFASFAVGYLLAGLLRNKSKL